MIAAVLMMAVCMTARLGVAQGEVNAATPTLNGASIHGVVTSTDGSVYEGAHVELELIHESSPISMTQQTDGSGAFSFNDLPAGSFTITISSAGFRTQEIRAVLQDGEAFDARKIPLPVAGAASDVVVSAGSQVEIAQEQLNLEEKQRVLGVFPNYYVSYDRNATPLDTKQKFQLAWRTAIDPVTWVMTGVVAGMEQASNTFAGYGQGMQGYGKRFGANYADAFNATMISGAVLPAVFKQDPRYFYKGTGTVRARSMYAIANAVICKGDNGHWQPNYSGILGGLAAGGISNLYYPHGDRSGLDVTFENALIGTAETAVQNLFQEFVVKRMTPKLPNYAVDKE
jgi:Carboxypeptidase regulatory-like domain